MRASSIFAAALLLTCCSTLEDPRHASVMDRIEKQVRLPKGAMRLNEYARFYADTGKGQIAAMYVPPSVIEKQAAGECEDLIDIEGNTKHVPCVSEKAQKVKAGDRLWLSDLADFPNVAAPGCQIVTIAFDQQHGRFEDVSCQSEHVQY